MLDCFRRLRSRRAIAEKNRNLVRHGLLRIGPFSGQHTSRSEVGFDRPANGTWIGGRRALITGTEKRCEFLKFPSAETSRAHGALCRIVARILKFSTQIVMLRCLLLCQMKRPTQEIRGFAITALAY